MATGLTLSSAEAAFASSQIGRPKRGGQVRIGVGSGSTTDTLNPARWPDTFNGVFGWGTLGASLTEVQSDGQVIGDAAESFEADDKATKWVFRLRKGAEFHNGKTLGANDVVASINHHRDEHSNSAAKPLLASVIDVKADGNDVVIVTLTNGNADFPYIASDFHLPIMPESDGKADWTEGVGLGPYKKVSFDPGIRANATRFENYYGETWFDDVEVLSITDVAARHNALLSGEVHYIDRVDVNSLPILQASPLIAITEVPGFGHYVAPMNTRVAPYNDNHVRWAIKYAIDRKEIVEKVLLGHGSPGSDNPIAPGVPFAVQPSIGRNYDPDRAKYHLGKAGLQKLSVDLSASDAAFAGAVDAAQLMANSARASGISINVVREPADAYWDSVWMKKPWCMSYWSGRPTPDLMFTLVYQSAASWNETFWSNKHFDELLVVARSELNGSKRAAMYHEMQNLVADDGGSLVLMFYNYLAAHDKKLMHGPLSANWDVDGLRIAKRWWFT